MVASWALNGLKILKIQAIRHHPMRNSYTCHDVEVGFLDTLELLGCNRVNVEGNRLHPDLPGTLCWPPELWMDSKYWKSSQYAIMQCAKATCHRISSDSQVVRVQQSQCRRQKTAPRPTWDLMLASWALNGLKILEIQPMRYHTMRNSYLPEWRGMIFETLELL